MCANVQSVFRISIHALHEESDSLALYEVNAVAISIHALHEESDFTSLLKNLRLSGFQSTLSMRRATRLRAFWAGMKRISIHALHEESD